MSKYAIDGATLTDIADAIRGKTGESALLTPEDMPEAIQSIDGGGSEDWTPVGDGKTRFWISVPEQKLDFALTITPTVARGVEIDWGDGTQTVTTSTGNVTSRHTYTQAGDYVITLTLSSGKMSFMTNICPTTASDGRFANHSMIRHAEIGDGVTAIGSNAFATCSNMEDFVITGGEVALLNNSAFAACSALRAFEIPASVTGFGSTIFQTCYGLRALTLPEGMTAVPTSLIQNCISLLEMEVPASVTTISASAFANTCLMRLHMRAEEPPTLANINAFNTTPTAMKILVPMASVDAYKAATNWSSYASRIVGE